ncbi:MAG: hypothetical protein ACP5HT_07290, partial [Conexivisphaera sp.]
MGASAGSSVGEGEGGERESAVAELLERLGAVGAATALMAAGYYLWVLGGYLNEGYMIVQWAFTLAGAALLIRALSSDHVAAVAAFRGRAGLALGALVLAASTALTVIQGWSQPGYV